MTGVWLGLALAAQRRRARMARARRDGRRGETRAFRLLRRKGYRILAREVTATLRIRVDGQPIQNAWRSPQEVPATTSISDALSKDLKQRDFKFVGSTIVYAHMQAVGMVNDHLLQCYRHAECARMG